MQKLLVFQALWAMLRCHTDGVERSWEENIRMVSDGGFDGVSLPYDNREQARQLTALLKPHGLAAEGQCFPTTVDDLNPVLENAVEFGVHHLCVQPNVRLRRLQDCVPLIEGWRRLAEQVDFPVLIETHRNRMTTDLFFTLDLLDAFPDLRLVGDISHYVVGREFEWPVDDENHAMIHRILDHAWAFHGRVATREQIQIEISFPHHKDWFDLFLDWWAYGFESWRKRAGDNDDLAFVCELGPKPYAISGPDGNDMSDRWAESLLMKDRIREVWRKTSMMVSSSNIAGGDVDARVPVASVLQ
jgi:hypothetical protein